MKRFFIAVNVSYLWCGFVLMVNSIRLGERTRKEKIAPHQHRWSAIYVELMYRYIRRTYVDSIG